MACYKVASMFQSEDPSLLKADASAIRRKLIDLHFKARSAHIGSGLSAIEILVYAYRKMVPEGARFILSKGHAGAALYTTLNRVGLMSDAELESYYTDGTYLPGHPAARGCELIPAATGSLGHGLPIANGMAYARKKLAGTSQRVVCLLSDGECNEGSTWEAALFASHHGLNNLVCIVDANGWQGFGRTEDVLKLEPFQKKWEAFGFHCKEIDGHNFDELHEALHFIPPAKPLCVIAKTIKGKGISFMEDTLEWHYRSMNEAQYRAAVQDLEKETSDAG